MILLIVSLLLSTPVLAETTVYDNSSNMLLEADNWITCPDLGKGCLDPKTKRLMSYGAYLKRQKPKSIYLGTQKDPTRKETRIFYKEIK